jgi:hypothetical protein
MNSQIVTTDCFKLGQLTAQKYKRDCFKREQLLEKLTQDITIQNLENKFDSVSKKQLEVIMMLLTESAEVSRQLTMVAVNENMKTTMTITNTISAGNHEMARLINDSTNSLTDAMEKTSFESIKAFWISSYENQKQNLEIFRSTQEIAKEEANLLQELFVKKADEQIERYNKLSEYLDEQVAKIMDDLATVDKNIKKIGDELEKIVENFEATNEKVQDQLSEITDTAGEQKQLIMSTRGALHITNYMGLGPTVSGTAGGIASSNSMWASFFANRGSRIIRQLSQGKTRAAGHEFISDVGNLAVNKLAEGIGGTQTGEYIGGHVGAAANTVSGGLSYAVGGAISQETVRAGLGVIGEVAKDEVVKYGMDNVHREWDRAANVIEKSKWKLDSSSRKVLQTVVTKFSKKEAEYYAANEEAIEANKFDLAEQEGIVPSEGSLSKGVPG